MQKRTFKVRVYNELFKTESDFPVEAKSTTEALKRAKALLRNAHGSANFYTILKVS